MKIGVMFGTPETTTGGNALKFYASVRLDIRRIGSIKKGEEVIGNETKVKVVKNKVAPPFKTAEFDILYGEGISREGEIIDMGVDAKVLEKIGSWYAYNGEKIGQGKDNAREFLQREPRPRARDREQGARGDGHPAAAPAPRPEGRRRRAGSMRAKSAPPLKARAISWLAQREHSRPSCAASCCAMRALRSRHPHGPAMTPTRQRRSKQTCRSRCSTGSKRTATSRTRASSNRASMRARRASATCASTGARTPWRRARAGTMRRRSSESELARARPCGRASSTRSPPTPPSACEADALPGAAAASRPKSFVVSSADAGDD